MKWEKIAKVGTHLCITFPGVRAKFFTMRNAGTQTVPKSQRAKYLRQSYLITLFGAISFS